MGSKIKWQAWCIFTAIGWMAGVAFAQQSVETADGRWNARKTTVILSVENNELVIRSTATDPQIATAGFPRSAGPFVLEMEVLASQSGNLQIFARWGGAELEKGSGIDCAVPVANQWVPVNVELLSRGNMTMLRIDPPDGSAETRLRNIRLKDSGGKVIKEWFATPAIVG
jgi:hypothetical protein